MWKRRFLLFVAPICLLLALAPTVLAQGQTTDMTAPSVQTGYADVNGLHLYYEIHGAGEPILVLHGAFVDIPLMGDFIPRLAETRQVIVPELQGHGRTADVDRPMTYPGMADDIATFMDAIGVEQADVFGYSLGGSIALQLAMSHPERVRKLIVASAAIDHAGNHADLNAMMQVMTADFFAGSILETEYQRLAPNPDGFSTLVDKVVALENSAWDWTPEQIQTITAPTLVVMGDSDAVTPEHAVEMFRLFGGGVNGDLAGLPDAQLAILPGATHVGVMMQVDLLVPIIDHFLNPPVYEF